MQWMIFFLYLLLGLLIALLFNVILGIPEEGIDFIVIIEARILILVFGGMLGGLLNSFAQDGTLELPYVIKRHDHQTNKNSYSLVLGFLGDCLLGITGAFISFFLLHKSVLPDGEIESKEWFEYRISLVTLAVLGGYSGKVIIEAALGKLLKSEIKKFKNEQELVFKNISESKLIEDVNEQISIGFTESKKEKLLKQIRDSSEATKDKILAIIKLIRRAKSGSKTNESMSLAENMLPIIQTLCNSSNNSVYWAESGYIYIDLQDWKNAIVSLNKAIDKSQKKPKYYLNRALAQIKLDYSYHDIFNDLNQAHQLDPNLKFNNQVFDHWVQQNKLQLNYSVDSQKWLMEVFPREAIQGQQPNENKKSLNDEPDLDSHSTEGESHENKKSLNDEQNLDSHSTEGESHESKKSLNDEQNLDSHSSDIGNEF